MLFKDSNGESVSLLDICAKIEKGFEYKIFVGTDSQVHKKRKKVMYATCIVFYKKGKGGNVFVAKHPEPYAESLRQRLQNEVWKSLEVAFELSSILPDNVEVVVHIDVNKSKKYKSGKYYEELAGMVTGQGFKCFVKPDSWAACSVADRFSR